MIARMARLSAVAALLVLACLLLAGGLASGQAQTPPSEAQAETAAPETAAPETAATEAIATEAAPAEPTTMTELALMAAAARNRSEQVREELRRTPRNLQDVGETLIDRTLQHLPGIVIGIAILLVFWAIARINARVLRRILTRAGTDPALASVAIPLSKIALFLVGVIAAMEQMGFNVGSLLAGVGVAGLAVGLAAQETLGNIFAGFVLLWDRPFRLGDFVTIKGTSGHVTGIGLRATRLRTLEHREVTLPNRLVVQEQIVNHTRLPQVRINVPVAVSYAADLDRVRAVLLDSVKPNPGVIAEPPPQVVVVALGESTVQVELRAWVSDPSAEGANLFRLLEDAKRALDAAGIEIPFPQRVIQWVGGSPSGAPR